MNFNTTQQQTAYSALHIAQRVYQSDAAFAREHGNSRLAQQFDRQAEEAHQLAMLIENQGD